MPPDVAAARSLAVGASNSSAPPQKLIRTDSAASSAFADASADGSVTGRLRVCGAVQAAALPAAAQGAAPLQHLELVIPQTEGADAALSALSAALPYLRGLETLSVLGPAGGSSGGGRRVARRAAVEELADQLSRVKSLRRLEFRVELEAAPQPLPSSALSRTLSNTSAASVSTSLGGPLSRTTSPASAALLRTLTPSSASWTRAASPAPASLTRALLLSRTPSISSTPGTSGPLPPAPQRGVGALIEAAASLPELTVLLLPRAEAGEEGSAALQAELQKGAFRELQELSLNNITHRAARALASAPLPSLSVLSLRGCSDAQGVPRYLARAPWLPRLRRLTLDGCKLRESGGLSKLRRASMPCLEELSLGNCDLWDEDAQDLSTMDMPQIRKLLLGDNRLSGAAAEPLARARWAAGLQVLDISGNDFCDEGVHMLCRIKFRALSSLGLASALLTDASASAISAAPWTTTLVDLDLSENEDLGQRPEAWAALAAAPLRSLRRLNLAGVPLRRGAAAQLGAAPWLSALAGLWVEAGGRGSVRAALEASPTFKALEARGGAHLYEPDVVPGIGDRDDGGGGYDYGGYYYHGSDGSSSDDVEEDGCWDE